MKGSNTDSQELESRNSIGDKVGAVAATVIIGLAILMIVVLAVVGIILFVRWAL
jgi:hypothetical protein